MRRIKAADGQVYQVQPSFIMLSQIGYTHEVAKGLCMYFSGASFDQITHQLGRSDMYWYRAFTSLGRNSLVGTTVKSPDKLPQNLLADEKHTWWHKERVYLVTTDAKGCFLGATLAESSSTESLSKAYTEFEPEAKALDGDYLPKTVNLDGWNGTQGAWKILFGIPCGIYLRGLTSHFGARPTLSIGVRINTRLWSKRALANILGVQAILRDFGGQTCSMSVERLSGSSSPE